MGTMGAHGYNRGGDKHTDGGTGRPVFLPVVVS